MEINKYQGSLNYSYVFGAFGTIELLNNQADKCLGVLIDPSFVNNEAFLKIKNICNNKNIPITIDLKTISKIRDKGNIFVIGIFKKYHNELSNNKHLVLYDINDVGVIGTIIRSMRGFNFENLVLINCHVDLFHEHLIRSTMGAFFQCNIKEYNTFNEYELDYPNMNFINVSNIGDKLNSIKVDDNVSLIFSNKPIEGQNIKHIEFKEDISLDNIVNIVLFTIYS